MHVLCGYNGGLEPVHGNWGKINNLVVLRIFGEIWQKPGVQCVLYFFNPFRNYPVTVPDLFRPAYPEFKAVDYTKLLNTIMHECIEQ